MADSDVFSNARRLGRGNKARHDVTRQGGYDEFIEASGFRKNAPGWRTEAYFGQARPAKMPEYKDYDLGLTSRPKGYRTRAWDVYGDRYTNMLTPAQFSKSGKLLAESQLIPKKRFNVAIKAKSPARRMWVADVIPHMSGLGELGHLENVQHLGSRSGRKQYAFIFKEKGYRSGRPKATAKQLRNKSTGFFFRMRGGTRLHTYLTNTTRTKSSGVLVGWFSDSRYSDGMPVAVAAIINEFGVNTFTDTKYIPPRPFIRPAIEAEKPRMRQMFREEVMLADKAARNGNGRPYVELDHELMQGYGRLLSREIRKNIEELVQPTNTILTALKKSRAVNRRYFGGRRVVEDLESGTLYGEAMLSIGQRSGFYAHTYRRRMTQIGVANKLKPLVFSGALMRTVTYRLTDAVGRKLSGNPNLVALR